MIGISHSQFAAFSPDGSRIASIDLGRLRIFESSSGQVVVNTKIEPLASRPAFHPSGATIAAKTRTGKILGFSAEGEVLLSHTPKEAGEGLGLIWTSSGESLIDVGYAGLVVLRDPVTGQEIRSSRVQGHPQWAVLRDGGDILVGQWMPEGMTGVEILDPNSLETVAAVRYEGFRQLEVTLGDRHLFGAKFGDPSSQRFLLNLKGEVIADVAKPHACPPTVIGSTAILPYHLGSAGFNLWDISTGQLTRICELSMAHQAVISNDRNLVCLTSAKKGLIATTADLAR